MSALDQPPPDNGTPPSDPPPADYSKVTVAQVLGDGHELSKNPSLANYLTGSVENLARGYASAQTMIGADPNRLIKIPGADPSTEEGAAEWASVFQRLGAGKSADDYTVAPELSTALDAAGVTGDELKQFAGVAQKAGLTTRQHAAVLDFFKGTIVDGAAAKLQEVEQQELQRVEAELNQLKADWGAAYSQNLENGRRAIREFAGSKEAAAEIMELMNETGLGDDPRMLKFLNNIGAGLKEDGAPPHDNSGRGAALSPVQAKAEINRLRGDAEFTKKWLDKTHPGHADALAQMQRLNEMAYPKQPA